MRIQAILDTRSTLPGWMRWRISQPFDEMWKHGVDTTYFWQDVSSQVDKRIHAIVLPRMIVAPNDQQQALEWFSSIRAQGTRIIYETDDDVFSESYVANVSKMALTPNLTPLQVLDVLNELQARAAAAIWTMQQCDAVTTSVEPLAQYIRTLVDAPVYVIPNAIDVKGFRKGIDGVRPHRDATHTTIGWAGGRRNESELYLMVEAWARIASTYKDVRFVVAGFAPPLITENRYIKPLLTVLPFELFAMYGRGMQVDIGCCSINDTAFCDRKSPIKAWEFALAGALPVCSARPPYLDDMQPLAICTSADDWYKTLTHYIDHVDDRRQLQAYIEQSVELRHDLQYEWYKWRDTYEAILDATIRMDVPAARTPDYVLTD